MLILNRKVGEKIIVGNDVEIVVLELSGGQVRLGFTAPRDIGIHRFEIWQRIQAEGEQRTLEDCADEQLQERPA